MQSTAVSRKLGYCITYVFKCLATLSFGSGAGVSPATKAYQNSQNPHVSEPEKARGLPTFIRFREVEE